MNYIRTITDQIKENLGKKPIMVLYGARQVGKTTLVKTIMGGFSNPLYIQGDDPKDAPLLENRSGQELAALVANHDVVVIDEAQRVENIGTVLKLIADNVPHARILATGSSSFDLANKVSEPLTGRNRKFQLYPLSIDEMVQAFGKDAISKKIEEYLTFGMYPQVVAATSREDKKQLIKELADDYLFKDLFLFGDIRNAFAFEKLVKLLALHVGSEISYAGIARDLGISRDTVLKYIDLLEQSFIVFRLTPLYSNKIKEINKSHKVYFYDTGMRNAVLGATDPLEFRPDKGAVFENFFIAEKMKEHAYSMRDTELHFWRHRQTGEVDCIESRGDGFVVGAYECKWKDRVSAPESFRAMYPHAPFECVTTETIVDHFVKLRA